MFQINCVHLFLAFSARYSLLKCQKLCLIVSCRFWLWIHFGFDLWKLNFLLIIFNVIIVYNSAHFYLIWNLVLICLPARNYFGGRMLRKSTPDTYIRLVFHVLSSW
jgi:hypothetical protein